jgi:hypothetical protein
MIIGVEMENHEHEQTTEEFNPEKLSPSGRLAYEKLRTNHGFEEPLYVEGEEVPEGIRSFNILADEELADEAFKSLLGEATMVGQLYALCGLYYTDHEFFRQSIERYRGDETMVVRVSREFNVWGKVSKIIELNEGNIAIIPPDETLQDWWKKVQGGYFIDIINGGFPASFRRYKDFYKNSEENL